MLWKCHTQYASKFGKLSNGHRTGKGQFSFQSQRRAVPNYRIIVLISHATKVMLKILQPGFNNMWTKNFQMYKLGLQKAEEPRSNCQHSQDHRESKGVPEKHLLHRLCESLWLCGSQQTGKFFKRWEYQTPLPASWETLYSGQEATVRTGHGTTDWFQIGKGIRQGCILSPWLI